VNKFYRYGHGKFETFATFLISVALMVVAIGLFWSGGAKVLAVMRGEVLEAPGYIALIMAAVSIVVKEVLYQYTNHVGNGHQEHGSCSQRMAAIAATRCRVSRRCLVSSGAIFPDREVACT
jgi:peptidoglycan biosynthesis protein MviN/MurJ (putative lipid II flippase)